MESASPHASPQSSAGGNNNGDGLNLSQLPSGGHRGTNSFLCCKQEEEWTFKPPLSVIVIQAPTPSSATLPTMHRHNYVGQPIGPTTSASGTTSLHHASSIPKYSSGNSGLSQGVSTFRLQPRNPAKCIPSPSRSMCSRGRKRRAYSISTPDKGGEGADWSVATETTFRESSLGTPMQDSQDPYSPRQPYLDAAMPNFQGLSLQSPIRYVQPNSADHDVGSPGSLFGSHASMARSCFSKYTATSPAGSLNMASPCSPAHSSSSPKIAPLTVLAHSFPSSASQLSEAAAVLASPTYSSKRPPRHGGMAAFMQSLDESASRAGHPPGSTTPPRPQHPPKTVHCPHSTPESTLSLETSVNVRDPVPLPHLETPNKQLRTNAMDSPGKRSVSSKSPTSTPLPKLSLTPRSSSNRPRQLFSSLPSPTELGFSTTEFDNSAMPPAATGTFESPRSEVSPLPRRQLSPRKNSYIPLPDWGEPKARIQPTSGSRNMFYEESTSLLAPPAPNDAIEHFLHRAANARVVGGADDDSLSASDDDDETFFLAAPSVIHEEKQASVHQIKHRKIRAPDEGFHSRPSFASTVASLRASNTSLRGMNFVTSCTSLDKEVAHKPGVIGVTELHVPGMRRPDSEMSIGLPLEGNNAPSAEESSGLQGGGRSSAARDLVTPPVMTQPESPPPLSPRIHYLNTGIGSLPPRSNVHYHTGSSPPWPCSGEAESSPFNMFSRLNMFASTNPDDSPHSG